jgi:putative two-component system response regulator
MYAPTTQATPRVLCVGEGGAARARLGRELGDGFERAFADGAAEAIDALRGEAPDALVVVGPSGPGEVFELLDLFASRAPVPACVVVGPSAPPSRIESFLDAGADLYLISPTLPGQLFAGLTAALRARSRQQAVAYKAPIVVKDETALIESAFEQDRLIDQLRRSRAETVDRLTLALMKRDVVSGEHVSRMAVIAAWLAGLHGLDPHRAMLLRSAAPMHDVGKIAIRDDILQKAGPLTMEERAEMERHPRIGFEILDGSSSAVLKLGAIVALTHHENWDGSGYPRGLRGIEIPIEGRICAVADAFDALLSDRPYRPAMTAAEARGIILEGRGRYFDPDIVDLLLDHFDEALALRVGSTPIRGRVEG